MTTLAAGTSTTISLAVGQSLFFSPGGNGLAVLSGGQKAGDQYKIGPSPVEIGPFSQVQAVSVSAVAPVGYFILPIDAANDLPAWPVTVDAAGNVSDPRIQAMVSGAGNGSKPRILFIGDSITDYGSAYQTINMTTGLFPFGGVAFSIVSLSWANGAGTSGALTFNKAAQTLQWTAPGDSAGQPVDVSRAGVYVIPSGSTAKTITVVCRPRGYASSTDGAFTVTTTAQTEASRRSGKTYGNWVHAKACSGFSFATLANGGSVIRDVTESASWQVQPGTYDAIVCLVGTNDIAQDRTLEQMIADYTALIDALKTKASRVFLVTMMPRSSTMTAGRRQIMAAANRWLTTQYGSGLTVVNAFTYLVDPASATADPISGVLEDGLHPTVSGGELVGEAVYNALAKSFYFDSVPVLSSQADTYDVTNNPQGNRLPAGGTFTGTGGTAGTGVTGVIAANWSVTRDSGADILAVGSQIARTDGLPGSMQRLAITNPGATSQTILIAPSNGTRPAISAGQVWRTQGAVVPSSLTGLQSITLGIEPAGVFGAFVSSWGANNVAGAVMSGTKRKIVMEPNPLEAPAGAAVLNIAMRVTLAAGGAATIDLLPGEWSLWRES